MIITRLHGGLGNQLFQYAFGRALAAKHNTELVIDTRSYSAKPQHGLLIDRFAINATHLTPSLERMAPTEYMKGWRRTLWNLNPRRFRWVRQKPFGFDARWHNTPDHSYLDGYWQSSRYFESVEEELRQEFKLRHPISNESNGVIEQMNRCSSLALHVRRGDYVSDPNAAKIYRSLSIDYYQHCVQDWGRENNNVRIFVFSNDIDWCQQQFRWPFPTVWIDHTTAATAHEDMIMLSSAQGCVMANSTFSWWSAWLGESHHQMIYTPSSWFHPDTLDDSDIARDGWIQVPFNAQRPNHHFGAQNAA